MIIKEYYTPAFLGDRMLIHMISDDLQLSSDKKGELIQDYYKNNESKLLKWAKLIKRKCPRFFDDFIEIADLGDAINENHNNIQKGKSKMIVKEEIPFESKRDSSCPYWYIFKHGIGPGTIPDDVKVGKVKDLDNYYSIVWLDRPLSTDELEYYDIYPETMNQRILRDKLSYTEDEINALIDRKPIKRPRPSNIISPFDESAKRNRKLKEAESYGWIVETNQVWEAYDLACEYYGQETVDRAIVDTLSDDELASSLAYLFRMWEFREWDEYLEGNNEEDFEDEFED